MRRLEEICHFDKMMFMVDPYNEILTGRERIEKDL